MKTIQDNNLQDPLWRFNARESFSHALDQLLLSGEADIACHSLKDMSTQLPKGLKIIALSAREDPRDAWVSPHKPQQCPVGTPVGTSSLRRSLLIKQALPHLTCVNVRGNIQTRLDQMPLKANALILAAAGLNRLGLSHLITHTFPTDTFIPAPGQGYIALVARQDSNIPVIAQSENDWACVQLERHICQVLQISCHHPCGVYVTGTDRYDCMWMIGDLQKEQFYYGKLSLTSLDEIDTLTHALHEWVQAHPIEECRHNNEAFLREL